MLTLCFDLSVIFEIGKNWNILETFLNLGPTDKTENTNNYPMKNKFPRRLTIIYNGLDRSLAYDQVLFLITKQNSIFSFYYVIFPRCHNITITYERSRIQRQK